MEGLTESEHPLWNPTVAGQQRKPRQMEKQAAMTGCKKGPAYMGRKREAIAIQR